MEDSFRARVDKIFGSLGGGVVDDKSVSEGANPSLWSLTDEEVERRQWNRRNELDEEDGESRPSNFGDPPESDLKEGEEEEEDEEEEEEEEEIDGEEQRRRRSGVKAIVDEDWDVQANIGRDCTLDYEEEEDEYDKVAVGTKHDGDRLYMNDIKLTSNRVYELNSFDELPNSFPKVTKDPRANHMAAKTRLEEDVETSGTTDTSFLSDNSVAKNTNSEIVKSKELDSENPKPILKKRKNLVDSTSRKRVRFSCNLKSSSQNEHGSLQDTVSNLSENSPGIPDYLRNPSKYTRYTFDSLADMDDQANKKAYMDIFQNQKKGITEYSSEDDTSLNIPKSVTFTPRMRPENEREHRTGDDLNNKGLSVCVTAEDSQENEVSAMEEDEPCVVADSVHGLKKPSRQYRAKNSENVDVDLT